MPKEEPDDHLEAGKPLPHCKALLICEKVTESQPTGKITLHNLIESAFRRGDRRWHPMTTNQTASAMSENILRLLAILIHRVP